MEPYLQKVSGSAVAEGPTRSDAGTGRERGVRRSPAQLKNRRRVDDVVEGQPERRFEGAFFGRIGIAHCREDDIVRRRKKGFGIPLARWFRDELAGLLADALSTERLRREGLFRPHVVQRLITEHRRGRYDHRKKLYTLLAWELWAARYGPV